MPRHAAAEPAKKAFEEKRRYLPMKAVVFQRKGRRAEREGSAWAVVPGARFMQENRRSNPEGRRRPKRSDQQETPFQQTEKGTRYAARRSLKTTRAGAGSNEWW